MATLVALAHYVEATAQDDALDILSIVLSELFSRAKRTNNVMIASRVVYKIEPQQLISKITGVNQKSLKNTLFRLNNGGLLIRVDQKIGGGGWVKYKINDNIIKEIQEKEFLR